MTNDIERYQKIKSLTIDAFVSIRDSSSPQVKSVIQLRIKKIENRHDVICEFAEMMDFLYFVKINFETLQTILDDKNDPEYATPHKALCILEEMFKQNNEGIMYKEDNLNLIGTMFSYTLFRFQMRIETFDWSRGWRLEDIEKKDPDEEDREEYGY